MKSSVLVVEDDDDIARLVRYHLESAGFRVQMFPRANGVIEAAEDSPPAVFLLDIMIPGGSGLDLCRQARQSKLLAHVPITSVAKLNASGTSRWKCFRSAS